MAWERNVSAATEQTSILISTSPNGDAAGGGAQCVGEQIYCVHGVTVLSDALLWTYYVPGQSWMSGSQSRVYLPYGITARRRPRWPLHTLAGEARQLPGPQAPRVKLEAVALPQSKCVHS